MLKSMNIHFKELSVASTNVRLEKINILTELWPLFKKEFHPNGKMQCFIKHNFLFKI